MASQPDRTGIPRQLGFRVQRPRLRRRIDEVAEPLLFVGAPAGFGKTSVLADWARMTSQDVVWFSCRPSDHESSEFWRRFVSTLTEKWPAMGNDASLLVARSSWDEVDLLSALGHDLDDASLDATAFVVDDCHLAESSQSALAGWAQVLPQGCRLLVASQHTPSFSVSKLHVSGIYTELRSSDLAFDQSETDHLLSMAGLEIAEAEREELQSLTEGWPAGLQLAVMAMRNAQKPTEVIESFGATPREVSDYLVNEVVDRMAPELVDFMTSISVLGDFDAVLCRAVTGREDGDPLLDQVIEHDAFIQENNGGGGWYRFHPMFNAFLQARLKSLDPEAYEQLHRRALRARHERGDLAGALQHAAAVNDLDTAAALVTESLSRGLEVGDVREGRAIARAWLNRFGQETAESDPQRLLEILLVLTSYGTREAERWLTYLNQHAQIDALPPAVAALYHGAWADYRLNRGEVAGCLEHNHLSQDLLRDMEDPVSTFARFAELPMQQAGAHLLVGDLGAAADSIKQNSPVPHVMVDDYRVPVLRSWIAFLEGDLAMARQGLRMLEQIDTERRAVAHGLERIFADLLAGGLHIEDGELDKAARAFARTARATDFNGRPVIQSLVDVWLARLATAQRKHGAAAGALAHARLVLDQPDDEVQHQLALETLRMDLTFGTHTMPRADIPSEAADLLHVRLLLDRRSYRQAAGVLGAFQPRTVRERIEWYVLKSLTERERDPSGALHYLGLGLELAQPHAYLTTILEPGRDVIGLLRSMPADGMLAAYVDRLLLSAERTDPGSKGQVTAAVEDLSSREITVLGLLSSRLTTREIADTLFISPNTLKTHTKSIYRKLGVTSRAEAASHVDAQAAH